MMQFTFLDMAGQTLFIRDDAERAQWTQEEMSLELEFPRLEDKVVSIGQRVFFIDPSTGAHQVYEVKQAKTFEPDHYQTVVAENICISELSDAHIDNMEATDISAAEALSRLLYDTQWEIGQVAINPVSSADFSRGSVWQAVLQIKDNWNVYIEPRVTLAGNGTITRYLDILRTDGEWNGVRLSIDKNMLDPSVTYDDSEVVTAMYGYGGTTVPESKDEEEVEINFAGVIWSAGEGHPAKPLGQTYIEDPAATEEYGRNGRARFAFYQNTDILEPEVLLQKTWESLQVASKPAISIEGTVADLYRMGYADQPIKLHDIALVEVLPAGYKQQIQIIRMTTDLLDPSATTLTIGSYIPNIVYIERQTNEQATGSRGGGGGNKSKQTQRSEYETAFSKNNRMIQLRAYQNDLDDLDAEVKLQEARITVEHDRITQEVIDRREADTELNTVFSAKIQIEADRITQEVAERKDGEEVLSSRITQTASQIRSEVNDAVNGLNSSITQTASQIRSEVRDTANGLSSSITQTASQIRSEVRDTANGLQSSITQTASQIRSEVSDTANGLQSSITQTASQIRSEVSDTANGLQSSITQTASQIRSEVRATENDLHSSITQTASQIRAEVSDTANGLQSSITQTASQIRAEVRDTANGLNSSITQTASQIRTEVNDAVNGLSSSITQTASQIRSEVTDTANGLQSSITQNANKIALVVEGTGENAKIKPASIVAAINNGASSIKISADHIILDGQAVADSLDSETISVSGLDCGSGTISTFDCDNSFTFEGSSFTFGSYAVEWKSKTIQSFSSSTLHHFTYNDSGTTGSVNGRVITNDSSSTIYYLGR